MMIQVADLKVSCSIGSMSTVSLVRREGEGVPVPTRWNPTGLVVVPPEGRELVRRSQRGLRRDVAFASSISAITATTITILAVLLNGWWSGLGLVGFGVGSLAGAMSGWLGTRRRTRREDAQESDPSKIRIESILDLILSKNQTILEAEKRQAEKRPSASRRRRRRR